MSYHHVVTAHILNVKKLFLGRYFCLRNDLETVLFAVGRIYKQVTEVARYLGAFHGLADIVYVPPALRCAGHVHDKVRFDGVCIFLLIRIPHQ